MVFKGSSFCGKGWRWNKILGEVQWKYLKRESLMFGSNLTKQMWGCIKGTVTFFNNDCPLRLYRNNVMWSRRKNDAESIMNFDEKQRTMNLVKRKKKTYQIYAWMGWWKITWRHILTAPSTELFFYSVSFLSQYGIYLKLVFK